MTGPFADLLRSLRGVRRRPGYALTVIATFALGIGAVTAVYTLIQGVLLQPLPYPNPEQLVLIREKNPRAEWNTSVADLQGIQARSHSFSAVAAMQSRDAMVTGGGEPQWVRARWVTADFFTVMGFSPARGRAFRSGEDQPGVERTVVVGNAFAERTFGEGADPLGRSVMLDGVPYTVVGVTAPGAELLPAMRADLWPVLQLETPKRRGPFMLGTVARLKPGVTLTAARDDLAAVSRTIFPAWQQGFQDETARLTPRSQHDAVVGTSGGFLWVAFGAVVAVLLIAVVNIANLMLMRATERANDLAVRRALGASRGRLAALLISESLALAALGGLAGVALAKLLLALYLRLGSDLPRLAEVAIDARVLAVAAALSLVCGLVLGAVPLLFGSADGAPKQTRGAGAGRGQQLARNGLVALEFALALPLLLGAGLLIDSLLQLRRVDPGFDPDRVLTAHLKLLPANHPDAAAQRAFWQRALPELAAIPGVSGVGLAGVLPPSCGCYNDFDVVGRPSIQGQKPMSPWIPVTAGFFEALAVPLREGRGFEARDTPDSPPVVLVSETWAKRYFPGESAVGKQLYEGGDTSQAVTVIGVVGDVRFDGLRNAGEAVFAPISQGWPSNPTYVYLRTQLSGDQKLAALALSEPLRQTLRRLDPDLVPTEVTSMASLLDDSLGGERQWAVVITGFALAAVLLAAVGVFSVLAAYVARQQREIGIRLALGADRRRVVRGVIGRGFAWALGGTAVGVVLAFFLTRSLESLLFAVGRFDALNLLGAMALLLAVAFAACWLPARRAAAVDPMVALRYE